MSGNKIITKIDRTIHWGTCPPVNTNYFFLMQLKVDMRIIYIFANPF